MRSPKATKRIRKAPKHRTKPNDKEAATNSLTAAPELEEAPVVEAPAPEPATAEQLNQRPSQPICPLGQQLFVAARRASSTKSS